MSELYNQAQENYFVNKGLTPLPKPHITGMKLKADIVLGDFVFNTIDEYGVTWVITDIEGWWNHPEPSMPDIPRGFGDGSYDVKGRYQARMLTLSGSFLTPTPDLAEAARDRLIAATDLVYKGAWLKTGSDGKRASFVRLNGATQINTTTARGRTDFSIGLKAADPIKYTWNDAEPDGYNIVEIPATNRVSGSTGIETITNVGNVAVPVQIEIQGPVVAPAYVVVNKNTATEKLLAVVGTLRGRLTSSIVNKQLTFNTSDTTTPTDVLTLTTRSAHGLLANDIVEVSGLSEETLNGDFTVSSVPTETTLNINIFDPPLSTVKSIVSKKLAAGVATIETATPHGFVTSNAVFIDGVDDVFNGTQTITSTPTTTTFTFAKVRSTSKKITGSLLIENSATLTTADPHGFVIGDTVEVSNLDINYNGTFEVTGTTSNTFSYASTRTNSKAITTKALSNDIATITTAAAHGLVVGESVTVSGLDATFDGGGKVVTSLNSTTFNYQVDRESQVRVSYRSRFSGVATFYTRDPHSFVVGEQVTFKGSVGGSGYPTFGIVTSVPSNTTFSIANAGQPDESAIDINATVVTVYPSKRYIASKQLIGGIVTIYTSLAHGFLLGEQVTVIGLGTAYDGTYLITSIPFANAFTYTKSGSNSPLSSAGTLIATRARAGNIASITTSAAHGLTVGQYVTVSGMDSAAAALNGNYIVASAPTTTSFTYTTETTGTITSAAPSGGTAAVFGGFALVSGTIPSTADAGILTASGNLPFTAVTNSATAAITGDVLSPSGGEIDSSGVAVKNANIPFTPGLTGATIDFGPDLIEIDTLSKDVALNGEYSGARAKLDVFTDFFYLQPGENTIEFYDSSSSSSTSLLKIYYRSGYLG